MKNWIIFTQNANCPFYPTILSLPSSISFPDWPPNSNPKKEKWRKVSPFIISPLLCTLSFFHNNMEGSIGTITGIGHFASSTKTKQQKKKKKRYNLMTESLWSNNTSNRFKFIKTLTRRKNLWPLSLIWNNDYLLKQWLTQ